VTSLKLLLLKSPLRLSPYSRFCSFPSPFFFPSSLPLRVPLFDTTDLQRGGGCFPISFPLIRFCFSGLRLRAPTPPSESPLPLLRLLTFYSGIADGFLRPQRACLRMFLSLLSLPLDLPLLSFPETSLPKVAQTLDPPHLGSDSFAEPHEIIPISMISPLSYSPVPRFVKRWESSSPALYRMF